MSPTKNRKGPGGARKGAGRPPLGDDARTVTKRIRLTPEEAATQEAAAAASALTWSEWIREAIELALARGSTR